MNKQDEVFTTLRETLHAGPYNWLKRKRFTVLDSQLDDHLHRTLFYSMYLKHEHQLKYRVGELR